MGGSVNFPGVSFLSALKRARLAALRGRASASAQYGAESRTSTPGARSAIVIAAIAFVLTSCATNHMLMPTPVLYTGKNARRLFTQSSIDSHRPSLDLLFITDRAPAEQADDVPYTAGRSRSVGFGSALIEFGEDVSWDVLVKESTAAPRANPLQLELGPTTELGSPTAGASS